MTTPRTDTRAATAFHTLTAVLGAAAVLVQLVLVARGTDVLVPENGAAASTATRIVRFFSYFTIQSNLLVILTAASLALRPRMDGRVWRVLRLDALVGITVTGIVYATLLAPLVNLSGLAGVTDKVFHYAIPVLAVVGWVLFGPRPRVDRGVVIRSLIWPLLYMVYIAAFGAATGWYPYPFIDVVSLGYGRVLVNALGILVLILLMGLLYRWLDRKLPARP